MSGLSFNAAKVAPRQAPEDTATAPAPRSWSPYQQAIFSFIEDPHAGNAIVNAVAGSGKSTTIVEGMNRIPSHQAAIFLAFNKSIAEELKGRGVNARTFHSLTYSPVLRAIGASTVDGDKLRKLSRANMTGEDAFMYGSFAEKLVGLARQSGVGCLTQDTDATWVNIADHHDLEIENENAHFGRGIELARQLLQWANASRMVDFDDLLYRAVKDGIALPRFDFVFVDEAQDTNAIQRAILRKILKPTSRIIAVGDPAQAIYGFRGADSDSLHLIGEEFACRELPLTVSYRCPVAVVNHARQWVDHIEAAEGAPDGKVEYKGTKWKVEDFESGDLVVCRSTAPLLALGYKMLKAKKPVTIMGREIGQGLKSVVNKMKAPDIDELEKRLAEWAMREQEKAGAANNESKVNQIKDKYSAMACLIEGLPEDQRTIEELLRTIDTLFSDNGGSTKLATIHKAKGLEARRVYWLNSSKCPSPWARQAWQRQQEKNLCYVATTRAKEELLLIEDGT